MRRARLVLIAYALDGFTSTAHISRTILDTLNGLGAILGPKRECITG